MSRITRKHKKKNDFNENRPDVFIPPVSPHNNKLNASDIKKNHPFPKCTN